MEVKKEEVKEEKKGSGLGLVILVYAVSLVFAVGLFIGAAIYGWKAVGVHWNLLYGVIAAIMLIMGIVLIRMPKKIVKRVRFPNWLVVDRRGELIEMPPGYRLIWPLFGYDEIYGEVPKGIQYGIKLFPETPQKSIALKDGGKVKLVGPTLWIEIKSPIKAMSKAKNFEMQLREMAENRVGGTFNALNYKKVMEMRTPVILLHKGEEKKPTNQEVAGEVAKKIDKIIEESGSIKKFLEEIGGDYQGFTLKDIDFDEPTERKRAEIIAAEMDVAIAKQVAEAMIAKAEGEKLAQQTVMKAISDTKNDLVSAGYPEKVAQQMAFERHGDLIADRKGGLKKIIWQGKSGSIPELLAQIGLSKDILLRGSESPGRRSPSEGGKSERVSEGNVNIKELEKRGEEIRKATEKMIEDEIRSLVQKKKKR